MTRHYTHPILLHIRDLLIEQAADAWAGTPADEVADTEYLRGQAELIANSTGAFADDEDAPLTIRDEIIRRIR